MSEFLDHLFGLALYPFTSGSVFCYLPCMLTFAAALFGLVRRLMRG